MKKANVFFGMLGLAACFAVGGTLSINQASAADPVNNTVETVALQMENGAAVSVASENYRNNGIRFDLRLPQAEYEALLANGAYESVTFGVAIAPNSYNKIHTIDAGSLFGVNDQTVYYNWRTENGTGDYYYEESKEKVEIINLTGTEMTATYEEGYVSFKAAMTDIWGGEDGDEINNIAREFIGVGYMEYVNRGETQKNYRFAANNDNVRSMAYVAQLAMADTSDRAPTATQKERLQTAYLNNVANVDTSYTVEYYYGNATIGYELLKTVTDTAKIDEEVSAPALTETYYAAVEHENQLLSAKALANDKLVLKRYYDDADTTSRLTWYAAWGGSESTAAITTNTDAAGLVDANSRTSVKIEDFDISGYNDYMMCLSGYTAYSADVKIVLNQTAGETAVSDYLAVEVTDETGKRLGALEIGKWQKFSSFFGNWVVSFAFTGMKADNGTAPTGTATIYFDNIRFYTAADVASGNIDKAANLVNDTDASAFTFTTASTTASLVSGANGRYTFSGTGVAYDNEATMHNYMMTWKTNATDISSYNGISFAITMKTWTQNIRHAFYLVPKSKVGTLDGATLDSYLGLRENGAANGFVTIADTYVAAAYNNFSGVQVIHITAAELTAAGYDLTNLTEVAIAFRDGVWSFDEDIKHTASNGWAAIASFDIWDFKAY